MRWEGAAGTPNELERKRADTPTPIKTFLATRIGNAEKHLDRFAPERKGDIAAIRREVSNLNLAELPVGKRRRWSVQDPVSQVTFQFEIERVD